MKPIGLSFKRREVNPFTGRTNGDLMIIHECTNCRKISCNRISGDDNTYIIMCVFDESLFLDTERSVGLACMGINLLTQDDQDNVRSALYGR